MFSGKIALGIVSVTVELNMKFLENVTKRQKINNKQEGAWDRALGNTTGDWRGAKLRFVS